MDLLEKLDGKMIYVAATVLYFVVAGIMIYQAYQMNKTLNAILEKL